VTDQPHGKSRNGKDKRKKKVAKREERSGERHQNQSQKNDKEGKKVERAIKTPATGGPFVPLQAYRLHTHPLPFFKKRSAGRNAVKREGGPKVKKMHAPHSSSTYSSPRNRGGEDQSNEYGAKKGGVDKFGRETGMGGTNWEKRFEGRLGEKAGTWGKIRHRLGFQGDSQ